MRVRLPVRLRQLVQLRALRTVLPVARQPPPDRALIDAKPLRGEPDMLRRQRPGRAQPGQPGHRRPAQLRVDLAHTALPNAPWPISSRAGRRSSQEIPDSPRQPRRHRAAAAQADVRRLGREPLALSDRFPNQVTVLCGSSEVGGAAPRLL